MPYTIEFSEDTERHLDQLRAYDRAIVIADIKEQLRYEPAVPTRRRVRLRETVLASWELRVGDFRVFYNVVEERATVLIVAVGEKEHNVMHIDGRTFSI